MNFISRIIKSINAMRERLKIERHEAMYGPHFLAKAWLNDKDIEEGKMWYYYCYIMCDKLRKEAKKMFMGGFPKPPMPPMPNVPAPMK